ncbi:MAG: transcriptional regulator [Candidatus Hodarchaeota archaeon]
MKENPNVRDLLGELDSLVHEPARLGILTLLHLNSSQPFSILQKGLGLSSGNLNSHLARLIESEYITQEKTFVKTRPRTVIHITPEGRKALKQYSKSLKRILSDISSF